MWKIDPFARRQRRRSAEAFALAGTAAQAGNQWLQRSQAAGECLGLRGVGHAYLGDVGRQETLDRKQMFADVEQAVTTAGTGQRLDFAEQHGQRIDVPALLAQPHTALAQHLQTFGQMAQERQAQFRRLLGIVLLLHCRQ